MGIWDLKPRVTTSRAREALGPLQPGSAHHHTINNYSRAEAEVDEWMGGA